MKWLLLGRLQEISFQPLFLKYTIGTILPFESTYMRPGKIKVFKVVYYTDKRMPRVPLVVSECLSRGQPLSDGMKMPQITSMVFYEGS